MTPRDAGNEDWRLEAFARRHFAGIEDRKRREHEAERRLVRLHFDDRDDGFFVEVGANDPVLLSQTWHLEQAGWRGILVEPVPACCERLRAERSRSTTVQAACGAPEQRGTVPFHVSEDLVRSTLVRNELSRAVAFAETVEVPLRTLDEILEEQGVGRIDFVSIDVEGCQLDVLRGFDLTRWRPELLLLEDHLRDLETHRHVAGRGYRLVKRTCRNDWYVPRDAPFRLTSPRERRALWRKVWLHALPRSLWCTVANHATRSAVP